MSLKHSKLAIDNATMASTFPVPLSSGLGVTGLLVGGLALGGLVLVQRRSAGGRR